MFSGRDCKRGTDPDGLSASEGSKSLRNEGGLAKKKKRTCPTSINATRKLSKKKMGMILLGKKRKKESDIFSSPVKHVLHTVTRANPTKPSHAEEAAELEDWNPRAGGACWVGS